jgi:trimeric autotransporter adhesin
LNRAIACRLISIALVFLAAVCQAQAPGTYTISTVAGTGVAGWDGDAGQGTAALINNPFYIALDGSGNLFIADQFNNRIRKLATDGTITTVAGTGTASFSGDGAAATSAAIHDPCGIVLDSSGNIYFSDTFNAVVRKITTSGIISTIAGTGTPSSTGDGGAATSATLNRPIGLALDSAGRLYIADTASSNIRMVAADGIISTVAGTGVVGSVGDGGPAASALLNRPQGVAFDAAGNLYIADTANHLIRKVTTDGNITTVAGNGKSGFSGDGGLATQASLWYPKGLLVDAAGNLLIADSFNSRIRVVAPNGIITTLAGSGLIGDQGDAGPALQARLRFPSSVALAPSGELYIADTQNSRIRLLTPSAGAVRSEPAIQRGIAPRRSSQ